jgi:hypothetical protein
MLLFFLSESWLFWVWEILEPALDVFGNDFDATITSPSDFLLPELPDEHMPDDLLLGHEPDYSFKVVLSERNNL